MSNTKQSSGIEKVKSMQDNLATGSNDNLSDIFNQFENVSDAALINLNSQYLELKEQTRYDFIFKGMTSFEGNNGSVEAVKLVDKDGNEFINSSTILVNSLKIVTELPCLVRIITRNKERSKSGAGNYMDMEVKTLPMKLAGKPVIES